MLSKLRKILIKIYNKLNWNNKLRTKGCKVHIGVSTIKGLKIKSYGRNNQIYIEDLVCVKKCKITLYGNNNKIIIKEGSFLNEVDFYTEDSYNEIIIGKHSSLCGRAHFAAIEGTKILIGDNCLFSSDLHFRTGDSHSILNMQGDRLNYSKDIIIEEHVWVGTKVVCLKGVHIAKNSVVAANTTLCKNYNTPNVVIAGVPGKIVKTDINWTTERK